jgi:hypothetical protein
VLSFSEQAQEPWAPEIPARVICVSVPQVGGAFLVSMLSCYTVINPC